MRKSRCLSLRGRRCDFFSISSRPFQRGLSCRTHVRNGSRCAEIRVHARRRELQSQTLAQGTDYDYPAFRKAAQRIQGQLTVSRLSAASRPIPHDCIALVGRRCAGTRVRARSEKLAPPCVCAGLRPERNRDEAGCRRRRSGMPRLASHKPSHHFTHPHTTSPPPRRRTRRPAPTGASPAASALGPLGSAKSCWRSPRSCPPCGRTPSRRPRRRASVRGGVQRPVASLSVPPCCARTGRRRPDTATLVSFLAADALRYYDAFVRYAHPAKEGAAAAAQAEGQLPMLSLVQTADESTDWCGQQVTPIPGRFPPLSCENIEQCCSAASLLIALACTRSAPAGRCWGSPTTPPAPRQPPPPTTAALTSAQPSPRPPPPPPAAAPPPPRPWRSTGTSTPRTLPRRPRARRRRFGSPLRRLRRTPRPPLRSAGTST